MIFCKCYLRISAIQMIEKQWFKPCEDVFPFVSLK